MLALRCQGNDIFYRDESGELMTEDIAKFIVPLLVGFSAFLAWLIAIAGASVACCCANIAVQEVGDAAQPAVTSYHVSVVAMFSRILRVTNATWTVIVSVLIGLEYKYA